MKEEQKLKWLRIDGENGWQIIVPESDIKPHGFPQGKNKTELAWLDCPCSPKINYLNKIIVHNSFEEKQKIEEAIFNPKTQ